MNQLIEVTTKLRTRAAFTFNYYEDPNSDTPSNTVSLPLNYYQSSTFTQTDGPPVFYFLDQYLRSDHFKNTILKDNPYFYIDMYNFYIDVNQILIDATDETECMDALSLQCVAMLNKFDIDLMIDWVKSNKEIPRPSSIDTSYDQDITTNRQGTREQTYIMDEYLELVAMVIILKTMVPVWSAFIASQIGRSIGTVYKEYYAFSLIQEADITDSRPFKKLEVYTDKIVEKALKDNKNISKVVDGVSSDDLGTWGIAITLVRRLCVASFIGNKPKTNIITNMHSFLSNKVLPRQHNASNSYTNKMPSDQGLTDNDKKSVLENYMINTDLPQGMVAELEYSVSDLKLVMSKLAPKLKRKVVNEAIGTSAVMINYNITTVQTRLIGWTCKPIIDPRAIPYLSKETIARLAGITQAVLLYRGHHYLGLLASSYPIVDDDEIVVTSTNGMSRIPEELSARMNELYPYMSIKRGNKREDEKKQVLDKTINAISRDISNSLWRTTCNPEILQEIYGEAVPVLTTPRSLKIDLAKLIVEIGARDWKK